jgi:hypothetical protein
MIPCEELLSGVFRDERFLPKNASHLLVNGHFPEGDEIMCHLSPILLERIRHDLLKTIDRKCILAGLNFRQVHSLVVDLLLDVRLEPLKLGVVLLDFLED